MNAKFRSKLLIFTLICGAILQTSCGDDTSDIIIPGPSTPTEQPDDSSQTSEGITISPEQANADEALTITFTAPATSALYGYTGDVYAHLGIVDAGTWLYVAAAWDENTDKCKMESTADNEWSITLSPTIREWFASEETSIESIGIVIRNEDGTLKGIESDSFIPVIDNTYEGFVAAEVIEQSLPSGVVAGINIVDNSTITFVLHDVDADGNSHTCCHIVGDFNDWTLSNTTESQMYRDASAGYWWITVSGLDSSKEYAFQYYLVDSDGQAIRIADPYARKILDPDNDKYIDESTYSSSQMVYPDGGRGIVSVATTASSSYAWQVNNFEIDDPDDLIIYEILLRDFTDSSDIAGAMNKLDYLQALGVTAIELMPTQEFDGNDSWGYNPAFFFAMDKAYGTDDAYKLFIDECHARGIAVILDVVYNHATGNNPLAKLYWDDSESKTATNNPYFNVDAPHPYSVFQDFNHENDYVRYFVKRNLQFLLEEYKFDGFRFDLTKGFTQKSSTESTASQYDASRVAILKDYHSAIVEHSPKAIMICEHFCDTYEERELAEDGIKVWRNANSVYCQTAMGWSSDSSFEYIYSGSTMPFGSCVGYMESHDEERMAYKAVTYGDTDIKTDLAARMGNLAANAAFSLLVPGPKMIWQFGEMGYDISIDYNDRTGQKPLHWEYLDIEERAALYNTYAQLLALRSSAPTLFDEDATLTWRVDVNDWDSGRSLLLESNDGKKLFLAGNFTSSDITVSETVPTGWSSYYKFGSDENISYIGGTTITLTPHSFVIYTNFE